MATARVSQIEARTEREQAFPNVESSGFSFFRPPATEFADARAEFIPRRGLYEGYGWNLENNAISVLFLEHALGVHYRTMR
jgi:hypothetical protein